MAWTPGMHARAVLGGGCLSFAGATPGALSGGMVPGAPCPGESRSWGRKGIGPNETFSR